MGDLSSLELELLRHAPAPLTEWLQLAESCLSRASATDQKRTVAQATMTLPDASFCNPTLCAVV